MCCRCCAFVSLPLTSLRRSHGPHAWHPRPWSPLTTVGFDLFDFAFSVAHNEICNAAHEQYNMIVGADE